MSYDTEFEWLTGGSHWDDLLYAAVVRHKEKIAKSYENTKLRRWVLTGKSLIKGTIVNCLHCGQPYESTGQSKYCSAKCNKEVYVIRRRELDKNKGLTNHGGNKSHHKKKE